MQQTDFLPHLHSVCSEYSRCVAKLKQQLSHCGAADRQNAGCRIHGMTSIEPRYKYMLKTLMRSGGVDKSAFFRGLEASFDYPMVQV